MLPAVRVLLVLAFLAASLENAICKDEAGDCKTVKKDGACPDDYEEIYKDGDDKDKRHITRRCCTEGSDKAKSELEKASGCQMSDCLDSKTVTEDNICKFPTRTINGKVIDYKQSLNVSCTIKDGDGGAGTKGLCCPEDSKEGLLTLLLGAEKHQFPHYAMVKIGGDGDDDGAGTCGGTIYNERYIITASHCMVHDGVLSSTDNSYVMLDVWMANKDNPNKYDVEKFIAHPNSTRWDPKAKHLYNDVALIKLAKDIKFGPHVKALPIAKKGFDPFKYSNDTVLMGVGVTDTIHAAKLLQRVRAILRADKDKIKDERTDEILNLGGIEDGVTSPRSGPGDSGGPAVCRDEEGYATLCGTNSNGPDLATCEKELTEEACKSLNYMEAQHYHDWFVSVAGDQAKAQVLKQPLFGAPVKAGDYQHQVHITTKDGPSCGGTLIEKDVVVTAAHCVVDDNGKNKKDVTVFTGIRDLDSDKGKKIEVSKIKALDGFQLGNQRARRRRIAKLNVLPTPKYPYYKNDLALLKLKSKADIRSKNLLLIGPAPQSDRGSDDVIWTTEVSLPTDSPKYGSILQQRDFHIWDNQSCKKRMDITSAAGYGDKFDDNVMCGQEMYAGGAQCDRELGGGLICKGDDGNDVLCGVQVLRYCQLALPSAFLDINRYKDWIEATKSQM